MLSYADETTAAMARPLPVELSLPLCWALSRPMASTSLSATDPAVALLFAVLAILVVHLLERLLHAESPHAHDAPPHRLLGSLLQLVGGANVWLASELAVKAASDHPAASDFSLSVQTFLGICGIVVTALSFSLRSAPPAIVQACEWLLALLKRLPLAPPRLLLAIFRTISSAPGVLQPVSSPLLTSNPSMLGEERPAAAFGEQPPGQMPRVDRLSLPRDLRDPGERRERRMELFGFRRAVAGERP